MSLFYFHPNYAFLTNHTNAVVKLEREKSPPYTSGKEDRTNCCVSFTDASPDIEQAFLARGTNCCVSFSGTASAIKRKERRFMVLMMLLVILIVCITVAVIVTKR